MRQGSGTNSVFGRCSQEAPGTVTRGKKEDGVGLLSDQVSTVGSGVPVPLGTSGKGLPQSCSS